MRLLAPPLLCITPKKKLTDLDPPLKKLRRSCVPENSLYREVLLERLANPVNQGSIKDPDIEARLVNPLCGDEVLLQIKVKDGQIEQAKYSGNGCALSQVSASFLKEEIIGKTIGEVKKINEDDILQMVGANIGATRLEVGLLYGEL